MQNIFVPFSEKFDLFFLYFSFLFIFSYLVFDAIITYSGKFKITKFNFFNYKAFFLFSISLACISFLICIKAFASMPILMIRSKIASNELSFYVGVSFPFVSSCLFYENTNNINKNKKFLIIILFLLALISSSKQFIVLAFLYSVPWYKDNFKFRLLPFLAIGLFGFLLILILHTLTGRVTGSGNLIRKTVYTINGYFLGGLAVFQLFLDGVMHQHITVGSWIKTGTWIGNVYSGFYWFYKNQNLLFLTTKIQGISLLYAFVNYRRNSIFLRFIRVYSIYPFLFFIFSDLYIPAIKQWLIFVIAGIAISIIKKGRHCNAYLCINNFVQTR